MSKTRTAPSSDDDICPYHGEKLIAEVFPCGIFKKCPDGRCPFFIFELAKSLNEKSNDYGAE